MMGFFNREWTLPEKILFVMAAFLSGTVIGFLMSPVKKGIYCGNNNGNTLPREPKEKLAFPK